MKSLMMMAKQETKGYVSVKKASIFAAYTSVLEKIVGIVYAGILTT
ncbi:MAG: hypothetical protein OER78_07045 [Nitrosopumilus sp.]|nr:hypothetical protein [Nitrosopumilus sp.]